MSACAAAGCSRARARDRGGGGSGGSSSSSSSTITASDSGAGPSRAAASCRHPSAATSGAGQAAIRSAHRKHPRRLLRASVATLALATAVAPPLFLLPLAASSLVAGAAIPPLGAAPQLSDAQLYPERSHAAWQLESDGHWRRRDDLGADASADSDSETIPEELLISPPLLQHSDDADAEQEPLDRPQASSQTFSAPQSRRKSQSSSGPIYLHDLHYTSVTPFSASAVGAAQRTHRSLGLFPRSYHFRHRLAPARGITTSEAAALQGAQLSVPADISHDSLLRHGWSRWQLDDDVRLSVPDDARRPRRESAVKWAKELLGKPWWRWTPGRGYVYGRYKDLNAYTHGPGIALAQLAPPLHHAKTPRLPLIPNSSKRDLVWMIACFIGVLACVAILIELRATRRTQAKGKGLMRSSSHGRRDSRPIPTQQRTKATMLRDFCRAALRRADQHVGGENKHARAPLRVRVDGPGLHESLPQLGSSTIELLERGTLASGAGPASAGPSTSPTTGRTPPRNKAKKRSGSAFASPPRDGKESPEPDDENVLTIVSDSGMSSSPETQKGWASYDSFATGAALSPRPDLLRRTSDTHVVSPRSDSSLRSASSSVMRAFRSRPPFVGSKSELARV